MSLSHKLRWSHGEATILSTAAMLADATFLVDGKPFKPFARAPWLGRQHGASHALPTPSDARRASHRLFASPRNAQKGSDE